ncbi:tetratricopeptide repeat protein [Parafrankia sp. FMc6]|uniref:tetratricopeptide repeat protein n=1 Tax=Parafrankia soli TaxID=2599596 RepID=UPI0034D70FA7
MMPRAQLQEALARYEQTLDREHPGTLTTVDVLRQALDGLGDLAITRTVLAKMLPDLQRTLGQDHPDTLTAAHVLGWALGDLEEHDAARRNVTPMSNGVVADGVDLNTMLSRYGCTGPVYLR